MFGTVDQFTDYLKAQIMRNLYTEKTVSLSECRVKLNEEIKIMATNIGDKSDYELNLEKAYRQVNLEVFGHEES